jgi:hypothetical protein
MTTRKQQREASKLHATINPERCPLCRSNVTMTTVRKCRQCGGQCCTNCNGQPHTGRVVCKGCE